MRAQFALEWSLFTRNVKNRIVFMLFTLAVVIVAIVFVPQFEHARQILPETYEAEISDGEYLIDFYNADLYIETHATYDQLIEINTILLEALEEEDYETFLENEPRRYSNFLQRHYGLDPNFNRFEWNQLEKNMHQGFHNQYTQNRYQYYIQDDHALNPAIIEERTALQTLQRLLNGSLPAVLIALLIFYSIDSVTGSKKHGSILQSVPLSYQKQLWTKSGAVLTGYFGTVLFNLALFLLIVSIQNGLGPLNMRVPIYGWNLTETAFWGSISISEYLFQALGLLTLTALVFVRGITLLSVLFKSEFLNLIIALPAIFISESWNRMGVAYANQHYSFYPANYFRIGEVLSGRMNHWYTTDWVSFGTGAASLSVLWLIMELLLYVVTRFREFRKI